MSAKLGQLRQLGELPDAGVLTGAKFEARKAHILQRLAITRAGQVQSPSR